MTADRPRVLARQRLRRLARRSPVTRARHVFMALVAHNFKEALCDWAMKEIFKEERCVLYGEGTKEPIGILHA